jgi:hypothetical protein
MARQISTFRFPLIARGDAALVHDGYFAGHEFPRLGLGLTDIPQMNSGTVWTIAGAGVAGKLLCTQLTSSTAPSR